LGKVFISILLGLGLASLFKKVCNDKNCIRFKGPPLSDIDGKIFKQGENCVVYKRTQMTSCDKGKDKRIIPIESEKNAAEREAKDKPTSIVEAYSNFEKQKKQYAPV
jgi:hypothetical protein